MVNWFSPRKNNASADDGPQQYLPGRDQKMDISGKHLVLDTSMVEPFPAGFERLVVGMGCFWGAERFYWESPGVFTTAVGYSGGVTPNPTYRETCTARTGHTEAVLIVFDPEVVNLDVLFKVFWENHDPTQKDRQGNDVGPQYRSALFASNDEQLEACKASAKKYQASLDASGFGAIATEIALLEEFYYAEEEHQQYLAKNPSGYCNHGFCQVAYSGTE